MVWLIAWPIGAELAGEITSLRVIVALLTWLVAIHVVITSILFVLGAMGSTRGTEIAMLLVLLAMLQPLILRLIPGAAGTAVSVVLPPLLTAVNIIVGIGGGRTMRHSAATIRTLRIALPTHGHLRLRVQWIGENTTEELVQFTLKIRSRSRTRPG